MLTLILGIICVCAGGVIVFVHLILYGGLIRAGAAQAKLCRQRVGEAPEPLSATIVVPARDEEALLPRLLDSIERLTGDDIRLVLVDDRSSDHTPEVMQSYAQRHPDTTTIVRLTNPSPIANCKLNALIEGVRHVDSDLILFTDADCVVPESWVEEVRWLFLEESIGLALAPIETFRKGSFLSNFHAFDHIFKFAYTAGCAGINMPTGGFGNNLSIRRKALEEMGGLEAVPVTVTEDAALISTMREATGWDIRAFFRREMTVLTEPQRNWRALNGQEVRWHTGGLFSPDLQSRINYTFIMVYLTLSVVAVPFGFLLPVLFVLPAVSFVTMFLIACIGGVLTRQPLLRYWLVLPFLVLFSMVYNSYLTAWALLRPNLVWKGVELKGVR